MTPETLDRILPLVMAGYGAVMTLVLHTRFFMELAETRLPESLNQQFRAHRGLGIICLIVGGLWSLQNLWI